ncbi:MAG TPA: hypothetical protein GXX46_02345 [Peptococcaceae bacterium]|nr:hypothetical protein [Peptococcaceae bacterium]
MSNAVRLLLWTAISIGIVTLAILAFWLLLLVVGVAVLGRLIYLKFFPNRRNTSAGTFTVHTFTIGPRVHRNNASDIDNRNEPYTTVIDADDPDKEYRIPKIK